ncbi:MAG: aminoacyl-tRNA hydrolase [Desulfotomaculales bacterium]
MIAARQKTMLIVGLGNPGEEYRNTRHNAGFMVVERLAAELGAGRWRARCRSLVAEAFSGGGKVVLARPQTFMNRSGDAVAPLLRWYALEPSGLLVVCDDLDLPLGQIRLRKKGGDGGHRGLRSVIAVLGSGEFARLRVGIGRPGPEKDVTEWVLERFSAKEAPLVEDSLARAVQALLVVLEEGIEAAMNRFNRRQD